MFLWSEGGRLLGHIVSHEGVKVDPNKIKAMMGWPILKTLNILNGFLGLTVTTASLFHTMEE